MGEGFIYEGLRCEALVVDFKGLIAEIASELKVD